MNNKIEINEIITTQKTNIRNNNRNYRISLTNTNEIEKHQIQNKRLISTGNSQNNNQKIQSISKVNRYSNISKSKSKTPIKDINNNNPSSNNFYDKTNYSNIRNNTHLNANKYFQAKRENIQRIKTPERGNDRDKYNNNNYRNLNNSNINNKYSNNRIYTKYGRNINRNN